MRLTDIALAIPPLVMALAVAAVLSPDLINVHAGDRRTLVDLAHAPHLLDHAPAARRRNSSRRRRRWAPAKFHILFREILPNCVSALAVKTSLDCGFVILVGASLSFLGLGIQPPTPDLGTMVAAGRGLPARLLVGIRAAGFAILFVALGFNLLGDGLRDLFDVQEVR